jgi:undecaprenyl-diphosphatase
MRSFPTEGPALQRPRLARVLEWDRACAVLLNQTLSPAHERLWITVDRLGDCGPWLVLIVSIALLGGAEGAYCALHMLGVGVLAVTVYKLVKQCAGRPRPCVRIESVRRCVEPLDEFSFPSGHTLHAVAFSVVALVYFPSLTLALVPFVVLTGLSRIALGLHYPSDVVAGAAIGAGVALLSFAVL